MTVVAAYEYRDGKRTAEVALSPAEPRTSHRGDFTWVGLLEPNEEEMRVCAKRFGLHPLAVEDALHAHQLPKIEVYGDQLFVVARTATARDGRIVFGETAFFLSADHIVTVRHGSDQGHASLRSRLEERPELLAHGVDYVLHALLDLIVDQYFPLIDGVSAEVEHLEGLALNSGLSLEETRRLFSLRRDLLHLQRILIPMEDVCARLVNLELPAIDPEVRPYFRDVLDHVRRVETMTGLMREVLSSVMETSALIEQQQQNQITRKLAAWAAVLAVPTAIAGIYGMNFEHMPELRWEYGYFAVLGLIALICLTLWLRFRKSGWL
ncbi:magnesium/cobalt transporter CorA [Altericroceibacterium xinjiangense]|uniref:magnesium/cobalt transporter CorA n=1 Tax=Altericroceibacterium xinjiangense TaxID=762261 RepID=UPI000F7D8568|nr:magnesium/cobalt transporter CorA [Altericroceibacterium xinjiangense]